MSDYGRIHCLVVATKGGHVVFERYYDRSAASRPAPLHQCTPGAHALQRRCCVPRPACRSPLPHREPARRSGGAAPCTARSPCLVAGGSFFSKHKCCGGQVH
jgi:hypothetical protein